MNIFYGITCVSRSLVVALMLGSAFAVPSFAAPIVYDEAVSGDLASYPFQPKVFSPDVGTNTITGSMIYSGTGSIDLDSLAFIIAPDARVTNATFSFTTTGVFPGGSLILSNDVLASPISGISTGFGAGYSTSPVNINGVSSSYGSSGAISILPNYYSSDSWALNYTMSFEVQSSAPPPPPPPSIDDFFTRQSICFGGNCGTNAVSFYGDAFHVGVNIGLTAGEAGRNPSASLINFWEESISDVWNNHYVLTTAGYSAPVVFDVNFSTNTVAGDWGITYWDYAAHNNLFGIPNAWWNSQNFFSDTVYLNNGSRITATDEQEARIVAHEFGHLLGLYDEYSTGGTEPGADPHDICNSGIGNWCGSMMADYGPLQDRYMDDIIAIINGATHRTFGLGPPLGPQPAYLFESLPEGFIVAESPTSSNNDIPEPGTLWLTIVAAFGIITNRLLWRSSFHSLDEGA